jgi:diguanylate cyclase
MRYSDSKERSAELLRAALKFMGLHDAAFNPITFSVWYEHAAGSNARLDAAISESLATEPRLGDETVIRLFQDFVLEPDSAAVNRIGLQLHEALGA